MLSHVNEKNQPAMVDVSGKKETLRTAHARSEVFLPEVIYSLIQAKDIQSKKGPVFHTAF